MKKIELLAPAKDFECGIAAIKCGADAVYIGPEAFGARAAAGNTLEDIEKLISFAHKYRVKVYVTVNTILNDEEIPEAEKLIRKLCEIGTDAIIIQDMGLLELPLPPVPLIASTQVHNNTPDKVFFLEKAGFKRVILARELSLEGIKEIRSKTSLELEFFIHGSLCVCYSGQCYLSCAIGRRSGNRGICAQPCRKVYSLMDGDGNFIAEKKYLLSLKDLNLSGHIKDLIDSGIISFKIEGRLKDINYVKNIVSFYRNELDKVLSSTGLLRSSYGKSYINFIPDPYKTFNRGYTDYFIKERQKDISSINTPKSLGKFLGKVKNLFKDFFVLEEKRKVNRGDGLCFFDENNTLRGTYVNRVDDFRIYPDSMDFITKNTSVYRNLDLEFFKELKGAKIERKISINLAFYEEECFLVLKAVDEEGISALSRMTFKPEMAKNKEMALSNIKKQLAKFGDTEFEVKDFVVKLKDIYFIPVKILNELRRNLTDELRKKREEDYVRETFEVKKNDYPFPSKKLDYTGNVFNKYAERFYRRHGVEIIEPAAEIGLGMSGKKVMTTKLCLRYLFDLCGKSSDSLYLVDEKGRKYELRFNCKDCETEIIF